jgi:myosin-5
MGPPVLSTKRTERVLEEAERKVTKATEAVQAYRSQEAVALEKKRELEEENENLRTAILSKALEHASDELRKEHDQLRLRLDTFQSKIDKMREISLLSARVVDSRIRNKQGRQYVEYKLQIETDIGGPKVLWHRYSTFLNLAATLKAKNPHSEHLIPELQTQSLTGYFSDQLILDRIAKLNEFLDVVTKADEFQWGIRIDKDTCVYKRKNKRGSGDSRGSGGSGGSRSWSGGSRESIASLASTTRESIASLAPAPRDSVYRESLMTTG